MSKLVGIVNVTPDSFSDGGKYAGRDAAIRAIGRLIEDGADAIDIGAESTRPGATPVTPEEEWQRLAPVMEYITSSFGPTEGSCADGDASLKAKDDVIFSIDTRHAQTARKALAAGAHWINDVSGFSDPAMVEAVKYSDCKLVVMHSLSVPADTHVVLEDSADVMQALLDFAQKRMGELAAAGIARARIIFDPGIGFGKTAAQSLLILQRIEELKQLGIPLLVGHSRKSCLGSLGKNRDDATLAMSQTLAKAGVDYLRVHDVAAHRKMLGAQAA